jgi:hypothetical protein
LKLQAQIRNAAEQLIHQLLRARARFRKERKLWRELERGWKAAENRAPTQTHRTAIHEAGHAALLVALGLGCSVVSIVPYFPKGWNGFCAPARPTAELNVMVARDAYYLKRAMVSYAGAEAVRQLIPTDPNPDAGASTDERHAAEFIIDRIDPDTESPDLFFALARRRCALLVAHHQPEIQALARALEEKRVLSGKYTRKVFMSSLAKRSGQLMTF